MPRVEIPVTKLSDVAVAPPAQTNSDAANDHYISGNDGRIMIEIISTDAGAQTVTIVTPGQQGSLAVEDRVISVPAGATRLLGALPPGIYNQSDGSVHLDVTVGTLRFRAYHL